MVNINLVFGREKTVAVVDAGTGGASVAIMTCPAGSPSTILAEARSTLALEERDAAHAASLISAQIQDAAGKAMKLYSSAGHTQPVEMVYAFVHAPWAKSKIVHAREKYATETHITDSLISKHARDSLTADSSIDRRALMEASVIQVRLNGYATSQPVGKHAHSIDVASLVSECAADAKSAIQQGIERSFPAAKITWRSSLRAIMTVASEATSRKEYSALDIAIDSSSIVSVRDGSIEQYEIAEGAQSLLKRISAGKPADDTLSALRMLTRDACADEACEAIQAAIGVAEPELVRVFGEAFGKIAAQSRMANDLFIVVHPDLEQWMTSFFSRIDFGQFTITSLPFVVMTAASLDLAKWVGGSQHTDALTVCAALVNIECRA